VGLRFCSVGMRFMKVLACGYGDFRREFEVFGVLGVRV
jgi:hypothetical protein